MTDLLSVSLQVLKTSYTSQLALVSWQRKTDLALLSKNNKRTQKNNNNKIKSRKKETRLKEKIYTYIIFYYFFGEGQINALRQHLTLRKKRDLKEPTHVVSINTSFKVQIQIVIVSFQI